MTYRVYLLSPDNTVRKEITDYIHFSYAKVLGGVGQGSVTMPYDDSVGVKHGFKPYTNWIVEFRRKERNSSGNNIDFAMFAKRFELGLDSDGRYLWTIHGNDAIKTFLDKRIIAYRGGTNQVSKTDFADDLMKALVRENVGSSSTTDYDGNSISTRDYSSNLSVLADTSSGPTVEIEDEWGNLLEALIECQRQSIIQNDETIFNISYGGGSEDFQFATYQGYISDKSASFIFSPKYNNLVNPVLAYDYDTANVAYVGDGETGADRTIVEVTNSGDLNRALLNRSEIFVSGRNLPDDSNLTITEYLTMLGRDALMQKRPTVAFMGQIKSTEQSPYGGVLGWNLGDRVYVRMAGVVYRPTVRAVGVTVDNEGREDILGRVESLELAT